MVRRVAYGMERDTFLKRVLDEQSVLVNKERRKLRTALYASDFGTCLRRLWYQFFPDEFPPDEEISPRIARVFDNGNFLHVRLSGYLKRVPEIDFRDEIGVPLDELNVHGRCDGICRIDDRAVVVEFKSINLGVVEKPRDEHVGQLMWYLDAFTRLRAELEEDFGVRAPVAVEEMVGTVSLSGRTFEMLVPVEHWLLSTQGALMGELVYEGKQTNELYNFSVEYDASKAASIREWFEQAKRFVEAKERPHVKYHPTKYPCSWGQGGAGQKCPWFSYCHGENQKLFINKG